MKRLISGSLAALAMMAGAAMAETVDTDVTGIGLFDVQMVELETLAPDIVPIDVLAVAPVPDVPMFVAHAAHVREHPGTPASITLSSLHSVIPDYALSGGDGYHTRI